MRNTRRSRVSNPEHRLNSCFTVVKAAAKSKASISKPTKPAAAPKAKPAAKTKASTTKSATTTTATKKKPLKPKENVTSDESGGDAAEEDDDFDEDDAPNPRKKAAAPPRAGKDASDIYQSVRGHSIVPTPRFLLGISSHSSLKSSTS